jgi:hypothetical protein
MPVSILNRARPEDIRRDHFPFIVIENALPEDYFEELVAAFPATEIVTGPGALENNTAYRYPAASVLENPSITPAWKEFFAYHCSDAFFAETMALWGADIERAFSKAAIRLGKPFARMSSGLRHLGRVDNPANQGRDIRMDCQFVINSPVREVTSVRGPHLDVPEKLYAALLYCRAPGDETEGGDLDLFRLAPDRQIERFDTVRYAANTLLMWINTPLSIHAVTPRGVTDIPRRYINFIGETYGLADSGFHGYFQPPAAP